MRIRLINFRKYSDIALDLGNSITKISGESGAGKTTIFEAIFWCLYGKLKNVSTKYKDDTISPKTQVSMEIDVHLVDGDRSIQIDRLSSKQVNVYIGDNVLENDRAQDFINTYFGSYDSFLLTSYLKAEHMHSLISCSASEKREYTSLLFPDAAKYDTYKSKLIEIRKKDEVTLSTLKTKINSSQSSIKALEESNSWILNGYISEDTPKTTELEYNNLINKYSKERDELNRLYNTYTYIESQLNTLPESLDLNQFEEEKENISNRLLTVAIESKSKDTKINELKNRIDQCNNLKLKSNEILQQRIPQSQNISNLSDNDYIDLQLKNINNILSNVIINNQTKEDKINELESRIKSLQKEQNDIISTLSLSNINDDNKSNSDELNNIIRSEIDKMNIIIRDSIIDSITNEQRTENLKQNIISLENDCNRIFINIQNEFSDITNKDDIDAIKQCIEKLSNRLLKSKVDSKSKESKLEYFKLKKSELVTKQNDNMTYILNNYRPSYQSMDISSIDNDNNSEGIIHNSTITDIDSPKNIELVKSKENIITVELCNKEVEIIRGKMMDSIVDSKGKDAKLQFLKNKLSELENYKDNISNTTGFGNISLDECRRSIALYDILIPMSPSLHELESNMNLTKQEYDKNISLLLAYEKSYENLEYNRKLEDVLECPKCYNKLRYTDKLESFDQDLTPKTIEHNCSQGDIQKLRVVVDKLEEKKNSYRMNFNKYHDTIMKEAAKYKNVSYTTANLAELKKHLLEYIKYQNDINMIKEQILELEEDSREYISPEQYKILENVCNAYNFISKLILDINDIDNSISTLENDTNEYMSEEKYKSMNLLLKDMKQYIQKLNNIQNINKSIDELKQDTKLYITPNQYKQIQKNISLCDKYISIYNIIHDLYNQISTIQNDPNNYVTPTYYKELQDCIHICNTYKTYSSDIDIYMKQIEEIENDNREYISPDEHKALELRLKEINNIISKANSIEHTRLSLKNQLTELLNTYNPNSYSSSILDFDKKIEECRVNIQLLRDYTLKLKIQHLHKQHKYVIDDVNKQIIPLNSRLDNSHKLESILSQAYQEYVGQKLKEIEYDICLLGKIFFDESMNISLTPGKESSSGMIRPSFDLKVEYSGIQYDDVKLMSTGEKKRISLILLIVLTKYLDGKILLLDEALNSVSMDARGIIMNEISKLDIPVYITSHDDIPGGFNNELKLDDNSV